MKKIILVCSIISLFFEALQSQNFAPTGTKWRYEFGALGQGGTIEYEALNDTVVLGLTCRRVSYKKRCRPPTPLDCRNPTYSDAMLYFHERNDSLLQIYPNGYINLLFNFKANVGDSLNIVEDYMATEDNNKFALVTRKSDTIIGGKTIKFWELSKKCKNRFPIEAYKFRVFEKIYRIEDGLFIWGRCGGFLEFDATLCSFESGNWRFEQSRQFGCTSTAVNQLENAASVTVFPNPSSNKLTISSSIVFSKYAVYNASGQQLQQTILLGNDIDISLLPTGFYTLQLTDNEGFSIRKKIIKQ